MSTRTTHVLLAIAAGLGGLDLLVHWPRTPATSNIQLPAIEAPSRVRITSGDDLLELERIDERWHIVAPIEAQADSAAILALLAPFTTPVSLGPATDEGHLEDYTLVGHESIHLVVHDADGDAIDVWIGSTTTGGQTWVRLNEGQDVHRVDLGGRARWLQRAGTLRDRALMHFVVDQTTKIQVRSGSKRATALKTPTGWSLAEQPEVSLDPLVMTQLTEALSTWTGQRVVDEQDPANTAPALLTVTVTAGQEEQVEVVRTSGGWFARRADQTTVSIDPAFLQVLADPVLMWRDRRLSTLSYSEVVGFEVESAAGVGRWELVDQGWIQTAPAKRAAPHGFATAVSTLAELRVVGWLTDDDHPELLTTVRLTTRDGASQQFGVAAPLPNGSVPARSSINAQQTGTIDPRVATTIRNLLTLIE